MNAENKQSNNFSFTFTNLPQTLDGEAKMMCL